MDAIDGLMGEHRRIEQALDMLRQSTEALRLDERDAPRQLRRPIAFLAGYVEPIHHAKEEQLLFRKLCDRGLPEHSGPIAAMRAEHEEERHLVSLLQRLAAREDELTADEASKLKGAATRYVALLRDHFRKEDMILFVVARGVLSAADLTALGDSCDAFDAAHEREIARLCALVEPIATAKAAARERPMRTRPDRISTLRIGEREVQRDEQGYLLDPEQWNDAVAARLGEEEGIALTGEHLAVIAFMRRYFDEHGIAADARFVFAFLAERRGETAADARRHFFDLFPYGYVKQACKIAGMRQPRAWSTG